MERKKFGASIRLSVFWWTVRHYWHRPNTMSMAAKPEVVGAWYWRYRFQRRGLWSALRAFVYDVKNIGLRVYWKLLWWQPLRCNGNHGGWRTRVCDWLEMRARSYEDGESWH